MLKIWSKLKDTFAPVMVILFLLPLFLTACAAADGRSRLDIKLDGLRGNEIAMRAFLQDMPKGADLHNHLYGAVYPESWIEWAEADGLCFDASAKAIRFPQNNQSDCGDLSSMKAALVDNQNLRNELIDLYSVRDFVPANGWSGHDQFFRTFALLSSSPKRFGDMLAETANVAGRQNVLYLELLHTVELFDVIFPLMASNGLIGSGADKTISEQYDFLMAGPFGKALPQMIVRANQTIADGLARKDQLLGCHSDNPQPGCAVEIKFLHQPVRTLPSDVVFAHLIFAWHQMQDNTKFVGSNLVAPEDDFIALRDYDLHMAQMGFLQNKLGLKNVSLHAGELWLGLVHPKNLRHHIRAAIEIAKAKRIGHGTAIVFEDGYKELLATMRKNEILVEIALTSSDVILGIKGDQHPLGLYKQYGVPIALATDDEGVSRIDLTHEYVKAVKEQNLSYSDLKRMSYDSVRYSFLDDTAKQNILANLNIKFTAFETAH